MNFRYAITPLILFHLLTLSIVGEPTPALTPLIACGISPTIIGTDNICNGDSLGGADLSVLGGNPPYTYLWSNGDTTQDITGSPSGLFTVTVTDNASCDTVASIFINEPTALTVGVSTTAASCNNICDGQATSVVSGGISPYTYFWNDPAAQTTITATGLCNGVFTVTVIDSNNCQAYKAKTVSEPTAITISPSGIFATCGQNNGAAVATVIAGGAPPLTYFWDDPATQSTDTAIGLAIGVYHVTVTDINSCQGISTIWVGDFGIPTASLTDSTMVLCNGGNNGDASVTVVGGTTPYSFSWNDPGSQTTFQATGLGAGIYSATITDANGCVDSASVTIAEPPLLTTSIIASSNPMCFGVCDGDATASTSGGTTPYTFLWDDPGTQSTAVVTGLCAGTYNLLVTDGNGCINSPSSILTQPQQLLYTPTSSDPSCFGDCDGSTGVIVTGGVQPYQYLWDDIGSQTTDTAINLCSGTYSVILSDSNNCVKDTIITISDLGLLSSTILADDESCFGQCNGTVTISSTGGILPYTYLWDDPLGQTTQSASNLCAGPYNVTILDANACVTYNSDSVGGPMALTIVIDSSSDNSCFGDCLGTAQATASGGTGPFTYLWSDGQTNTQAVGLCADTLDVTVNDVNGCSAIDSVTITEPPVLNGLITTSSDPTCFNVCDGSATMTVGGGTPPYTYTWNDPGSQSNFAAIGLCDGSYVAIVSDTNGCVSTDSIFITEPLDITYSPIPSDPTCYGYCDGSIGVIVSGGTLPYQYLWDDTATQTTITATALCSGSYNLIITDSNNCVKNGTISITDPLQISSTISSTDENCYGLCDGTVTISPGNGVLPYTYQWDDPAGQTTQTANGLCTGNYNVSISDALACINYNSDSVGGPMVFDIVIDSVTNNTCFSDCQGIAQSAISGGTGPFTYMWSNGQTSTQAVGLCADTFDVTVTDVNGCTASGSTIITEPQEMIISLTPNNITCNGDCNGNITASVSGGGVAPLTFQWNDPLLQTGISANNLCAGLYIVIVTDASGCTQSDSVAITEPLILGLSSSDTSSTCGLANATSCVSVSGGTGPFAITWDDSLGTSGACLINVFAGPYNPTVLDSNGCSATIPVTLNDIAGPVVDSMSFTDVICADDSNGTATVFTTAMAPPLYYEWLDSNGTTVNVNLSIVFGLWGGTFQVTVYDDNGCSDSGYITVNEPSPLISSPTSSTPTSCYGVCDGTSAVLSSGGIAPYTYQWTDGQTSSGATGLCAGIHSIIVSDTNGCTVIVTDTIIEPPPIVISDSIVDVSCTGDSNGSVFITVTGGTPFYSYTWSPVGLGNADSITNLLPQSYDVLVTDQNLCTDSQTLVVNEPAPLAVADTSFPSTCGDSNGVAIIIVNGGTGPFTYIWDDPLNTNNDTVPGLLARDPYYVDITDVNGCATSDSVRVGDLPGPIIDSITVIDISCHGDNNGIAIGFLTGGTLPLTYVWDDILAQTNDTAFALVPGAISVQVSDNNGCQDTASAVVNEPPELTIQTSTPDSICKGDFLTISALAQGGTPPFSGYTWNIPGSNGDPDQLVNPDSTTNYSVWVMDINACPSMIYTIEVYVHPDVMAYAPDVDTCDGNDVIVSVIASGGTGGPYAYLWKNNVTSSTQSISSLSPTDNEVYWVTVSDGCTESTDSTHITIHPNPEALFDSEGGECERDLLIIHNPTTNILIDDWLWDFGDGAYSTSPVSVTHVYDTTGIFNVSLTVTSNMGCMNSYTDIGGAVLFQLPVSDFYTTQNGAVLDPAETSILTPWFDFVNSSSSNVSSVIWDFSDSASGVENFSTEFNPSHMYSDTGNYPVRLLVESFDGCFDTIVYDVKITGDFVLFAPNCFSPNGDGLNEFFMPKGIGLIGESFEMDIFDRWGDLIAKIEGEFGNSYALGWDGTVNDGQRIAQKDVYVWRIQTKDLDRKIHKSIGHVTLIR